MAVAFLANLGLTRFAGFKRQQHATVFQTVDETVDVLAVAAVGALVVLLTLNRIALDDPLGSNLGTIVVQIVPLNLDASVANVVFAPGKGRQGADEQGRGRGAGGGEEASPWRATRGDVGATAIGGIFLGFSVAPTEEIPMLATELGYAHRLAVIALSLALTYLIVFASGFEAQSAGRQPPGPFQHPFSETALAYLVSLLVALGALLLFGQIEPGDPLTDIVAQTLVLGLVTAIGGAAGRLVI